MNHTTSTTTPRRHQQRSPMHPVTIELPLATVEELDHLARLRHLSRAQMLRQIITAALLNDPPHLPSGDEPHERLEAHAQLTHQRSLDLARERSGR